MQLLFSARETIATLVKYKCKTFITLTPVVAPVTTALGTDNIGGDVNPSYGMQISGTNFINGLLVLLA